MRGDRLPLERLPPILMEPKNLRSLVFSGHRIASDGVPVSLLDGSAFPHLTRLEFEKEVLAPCP